MSDHDELDPDDRALIDRLRRLPPEGSEPDWRRLEAQIRAEVGDAAPRRWIPWWKSWRYLVPLGALATTAAVALIVTREPMAPAPIQPAVRVPAPPASPEPAPPLAPRETADAVWLDGEALELDELDSARLDELDDDARASLDDEDDGEREGILPVTDLGWVDTLDERELARAEHWLSRKRS